MTDEESLRKLQNYEAAKREYEEVVAAQRAIYEEQVRLDELEREVRHKMKKAEDNLLGRSAKHG